MRPPVVHVEFCSDCDKHQTTTWHTPEAYAQTFNTSAPPPPPLTREVVTLVETHLPKVVVEGNSPRLAAFVFPSASRTLRSALASSNSLRLDLAAVAPSHRPPSPIFPPAKKNTPPRLSFPRLGALEVFVEGADGSFTV
jgi:hypothetical protein